MTGEQQNSKNKSGPAFGEILINPQAGTTEKKDEEKSVPPPKPKKRRAQTKQRRKKNKEEKNGSGKKLLWCSLVLISLPVLFFLSCLAGAKYLLPSYIQNQLTAQYGQKLNRLITIDQAEFDPFTFDLQLADIYIGPQLDRQGENEPALCRIASFNTRLRPAALLQGEVLLEDNQIKGLQAEMVRRADGSFTDLGLKEQNDSLLPDWVRVDGLHLTESMLILRDTSTGHEYRLDDIAFSLPSAANRQDAVTPTLHALVNGNPVQIQGERQLNPDKGPVTRLTLELDDVDPQQILAWLPSMNDGLRITSKKTTASLELILPDNPQNEDKLTLSGIISFTGLNVKSTRNKEKSDQKGVFQCTAPNAELILQANPFRKQYRVVDLNLNNPQLSFPEDNDTSALPSLPFSHWPGKILSPALLPVDLMIDHLSINNGTLQKGQEQAWKNLQVELTGYQNQALPEKNTQKTQKNEPAALSFSARQGASKVRFQGTTTPNLDLIGNISLHNLDADLLHPYLSREQEKNQDVQLTGGQADLVMQVNPVQKQYVITELTLEQPRLLLTESSQKASNISSPSSSSAQLPFSVLPIHMFQPDSLPFGLKIDRFIINNGKLEQRQGPAWQDLHVNLADYHNRTSSSAPLSFTARQEKKTIRFQGSAAADLSLNGKVFLGNLSLDQLQPYLGSKHGLLLSGGTVEVNGLLQTVQGGTKIQNMRINQASIIVNNIQVQKREQEQQRTALLSADSATAKECSINLTAISLSCADLLLDQADFSAAAPAFFLGQERSGSLSSFNSFKIQTPKARLPLWGDKNNSSHNLILQLTELNMDIKNLQAAPSEQANLHLQAKINGHTKVQAEGPFYQKRGDLNLTVDNLDINLLNRPFASLFQKNLAPDLKQGLLSFQGQLRIPELDFQGNVQLKELVAENQQGMSLRWKNGKGNEIVGGMQPFFMHIKELVVQEPELQPGSAKEELPAALLALLRTQENKPVLPPFTIKQCRIQEGRLPDTSTGKNFTAVQGTLGPLASGSPASFTFSGKVNTREFTAQGQLDQQHAKVDNFTVAELPLENTVQQFAEQLGLQKGYGNIRWIPSAEQKDQGQVHFTGFQPQPDSEYALLLGLLTDNNGAFSFSLSLPATASPEEITEQALKKLHRLHLQAVVSPHAVLEKELPYLTLPQRINFIVGDSLPDFMDDLENFAALLERRPFLGLQLRGCYDDTADREYLVGLLQEEEDYRINLENIRRQEEMARLIAEEELRQVELVNTDLPIGEDRIPLIEARKDLQPLPHQPVQLPKEILPELARQRARVVQNYLINTLKLPADKITLAEPTAGGPWVDLLIESLSLYWRQSSETTAIPRPGENKE